MLGGGVDIDYYRKPSSLFRLISSSSLRPRVLYAQSSVAPAASVAVLADVVVPARSVVGIDIGRQPIVIWELDRSGARGRSADGNGPYRVPDYDGDRDDDGGSVDELVAPDHYCGYGIGCAAAVDFVASIAAVQKNSL